MSGPSRRRWSPGDVRAQLPEHPPTEPEPFEAVLADVASIVVPGLTHWQHPRFFAYFPGNGSYASILGELMSAGLGVQGMSWVTSPACTEVETLMLDWMQELLGLPDRFRSTSDTGGGVIQGSASEATLAAILSARWRATGGAVNASAESLASLRAYITSQAHSSLEKGLRVAGIGTEQIRIVPHDSSFAMRPDALAELIEADLAAGLVPFFVCSSRGTTSSMAFDPTPQIGEICNRHGVWLHVDGAMSGYRCTGPGVPLGERRARRGRQLLHESAQVDGRQLRLRPVLDGRPPRPAGRPQHPARVPPVGSGTDRCSDRLPRLADPPRSSLPRPQAVVRHPM